jgi:hypothetical protein
MLAPVLLGILAQLAPPPAHVEDGREKTESASPGSRWGVTSLAAGAVSVGTRITSAPLSRPSSGAVLTGVAGIAAVGVRYGLMDRDPSYRMLMPAIALVGGSTLQSSGTFSPFLEMRGELMSVSPGGPLQPNFVFYTTTGASTTPLGRGQPLSLQPHVGIGIGWNWFPKGDGGGSVNWGSLGSWGSGGGGYALLAIPVALAITAMVFAGRVEVRYTARPITGTGPDFVSVMFGVGS